MAFSVSTTTLGGNTARLITGTGNLDDLASALSTHGVTQSGRVITFAGTGAATYYRLDGTLTEQRNGVWTVIISTNSFVCWSGSGATTKLGLVDSSGARTSRVDIVYGNASLAAGADPYSSAEYRCFAGAGTLYFYAGSLSFECSTRSDMDVRSTATLVYFDAVDVQQVSPSSYGHIMTNSNVTTTAKTRFTLSPEWLEFVSGVNTVNPISLDLGVRVLSTGASTTINVISPQYPQFNFFGATTGAQANVKNPTVNYMQGSSAAVGIVNILRTLYVTFTDQLGASITSPAPNLITVKPDASTATTAFSAGAASYDALQSYTANSVAYTSSGTGYTDLGTYDFYAVGFGYASQYKTVNVKTAHNGNSGITWAATSVKSSLVTTAYASVTTSGFSLSTGSDLLTISASRTANQAAEYLFKHAYDNPTSSYWLSRNHTPATVTSGVVSFGTLDITVNDTYVLTTTLPIDFTSGTLSTEFATGSNYTYTGGQWEQASTVPTFTGGTLTLGTEGTFDFVQAASMLVQVNPSADNVHYVLSGSTFTGTLTVNNLNAHPVTIEVPAGVTTSSTGNTGGTITFSAPQVYQEVVITGLVAGTRVQIYDTTSSTELANATSTGGNIVFSSGGTVATWTDPVSASASRAIRVRLAYVSGSTAKTFIEANIGTCGTTDADKTVSYLANQVNDTVYINNAITGSGVTGVTFTDSSPDVVNIDVAANTISWKTIYAAWVYYAFTSTGIATDIDYIQAVDEANYVLSNMKIKNTSSPTAPLEVTGGYGRDSTTNAAIDLADTSGGTLVFAPDHVVSYAVGSGVTSGDVTDIAAAVLTAASSAPIHANIKKVADTTVNGSGTGADPWGP